MRKGDEIPDTMLRFHVIIYEGIHEGSMVEEKVIRVKQTEEATREENQGEWYHGDQEKSEFPEESGNDRKY